MCDPKMTAHTSSGDSVFVFKKRCIFVGCVFVGCVFVLAAGIHVDKRLACCSVLQLCGSVLQSVAVRCSVLLQCVAVQCVAVCIHKMYGVAKLVGALKL